MAPRLLALSLLAACAAPRSSEVLRISGMTCNRETMTGSHILRWYCQLEADGPQYQLGVPVRLDLRGR